MRKWDSEQSRENAISIRLDGEEVASVYAEDDHLSEEDRAVADFIVDACNAREREVARGATLVKESLLVRRSVVKITGADKTVAPRTKRSTR